MTDKNYPAPALQELGKFQINDVWLDQKGNPHRIISLHDNRAHPVTSVWIKGLDTYRSEHFTTLLERDGEPVLQYRTPTDQDALSRPQVEVREGDTDPWDPRTLLAVVSQGNFPFVTVNGTGEVGSYSQCRITEPYVPAKATVEDISRILTSYMIGNKPLNLD